MPKLFQKIIDQVLSSFDAKWKDTQILQKELESNLLDHKEHLVSCGANPEEAERIVAEKFGNPTTIGEMFRQNHFARNLKRTKILAGIIGIISIATGLDYTLRTKTSPIILWGILAIIGGICAVIASKKINYSRSWQNLAVAGFFFLAVGQVLAIVAGVELVNSRFYTCSAVPELSSSSMCIRLNEAIFSLGIHPILFVLCLWIVYEILFSDRKAILKTE